MDLKNDINFHFRQPPPQERPQGGLGGARGGIPPKIKCYVNFGVFNSGDFKNDFYFHFRLLQPRKGAPGGGLGGQRGYIDVILILGFLIVGNFILGSPNLSKGTPWRWLGSEEV